MRKTLTDLPEGIKWYIYIQCQSVMKTSIIYMLNNLEKVNRKPYIPFKNNPTR